MTRASAWTGLALGLCALIAAIQGVVSGVAFLWPGVAAALLLVTGAMTLRRGGWPQAAMSVVALVPLARYLPLYFQTYRPWPALAFVLLGSFTFGLALLGLLLDRYPAAADRRAEAPRPRG